MVRLICAWAATSGNVTGCPAAASSAQAASTRASSSWPAGLGLGDEQVEPFDEAAVAGGFLAPAAGGGVGGECFGVGALQLQPGGHDAPVPNSTPSVPGRYPLPAAARWRWLRPTRTAPPG